MATAFIYICNLPTIKNIRLKNQGESIYSSKQKLVQKMNELKNILAEI